MVDVRFSKPEVVISRP